MILVILQIRQIKPVSIHDTLMFFVSFYLNISWLELLISILSVFLITILISRTINSNAILCNFERELKFPTPTVELKSVEEM